MTFNLLYDFFINGTENWYKIIFVLYIITQVHVLRFLQRLYL